MISSRRPTAALATAAILALGLLAALLARALPASSATPSQAPAVDPREVHLQDLDQLTSGGENAEGYWSPDGKELIFQSQRPPFGCDQIFRLPADGTGEPALVSSGKGRTTCSYFLPGGRVLYSSTHAAGAECPPPPDRSQGYVWAIYPSYEIWTARPDGSDPRRLTKNEAYDAEATVCPTDGSIVFTSTRDGDLELYRMQADGSGVRRLTSTPGYDGGAFFSPDCSEIVWRASRPKEGEELDDYRRLLGQGLVRPGKLEIWIADADGTDARQLTYLGAASFGPSFFPSGRRVIFSTNYSPEGGGAAPPGGELWVADADGTDARQLTYLGAASFGPSFFPSGRRVIFSTNYSPEGGGAAPREFELWAIDTDGTDLERLTWTPGFDGFPMFSPDGTRLAFASNRNQSQPGETNLFVARWREAPAAAPASAGVDAGMKKSATPAAEASAAADRYMADVRWLADDAREGRGIGTRGLAEAAGWLAARFRALGLEPAGDGGYLHGFEVPVAVEAGPATEVVIDGQRLSRSAFEPSSFSSSNAGRPVEAEVVPAGYGITAPELDVDDYRGVDVKGKIALLRRFTPEGTKFDSDAERRYGDLRYKAWNAREHGAVGVIVVDYPASSPPASQGSPGPAGPHGGDLPPEAALPKLRIDAAGDAGIPAVVVTREAGAPLFAGRHRARLVLDLERRTARAANVSGVLRAGAADRLPGAVLIGAHYDHLGMGGSGSLEPDAEATHNGADDNASGTAALLEAARLLIPRRAELPRDVYFVAFSGEEEGVLGSTAFTRRPPQGLRMTDLVAMLNMDMVGRLRENRLSILGDESAEGWRELVDPACARAGLTCSLGGDGYGPSDQTPFYASGIPVLHFFTGIHGDYHRPSDDAERINAAGGARVAAVVADVAAAAGGRAERLAYRNAPAPLPAGDVRSGGASLGTVPDYAGTSDGRPGVPLAGVRPGSPAEKAGLKRGDLLVELGGTQIRDIYDFTYVLRKARSGETVTLVYERDGRRVSVPVTFGRSGVR